MEGEGRIAGTAGLASERDVPMVVTAMWIGVVVCGGSTWEGVALLAPRGQFTQDIETKKKGRKAGK